MGECILELLSAHNSAKLASYKYIHGPGATSDYLALGSDFANPAGKDATGVKVTIDGTSNWNGQTMERTELIPQTSENLGVRCSSVARGK